MEVLEQERIANGPFSDLSDFIARVDGKSVNKRSLENLIKSGSFDCIQKSRAELFEGRDVIMRHINAATMNQKKIKKFIYWRGNKSNKSFQAS